MTTGLWTGVQQGCCPAGPLLLTDGDHDARAVAGAQVVGVAELDVEGPRPGVVLAGTLGERARGDVSVRRRVAECVGEAAAVVVGVHVGDGRHRVRTGPASEGSVTRSTRS